MTITITMTITVIIDITFIFFIKRIIMGNYMNTVSCIRICNCTCNMNDKGCGQNIMILMEAP